MKETSNTSGAAPSPPLALASVFGPFTLNTAPSLATPTYLRPHSVNTACPDERANGESLSLAPRRGHCILSENDNSTIPPLITQGLYPSLIYVLDAHARRLAPWFSLPLL